MPDINGKHAAPVARGPTEAEVFARSPTGPHLVPLDLAREIDWALDRVDELLGAALAEDGAA